MSLARAFFAAGARTVLGSRQPLSDHESSRLFAAFYHHLGAGRSVGESLALAQRERLGAGAPGAAWSALMVLGDADFVPFPGGVPAPLWCVGEPPRAALAILATIFAAALLWRGWKRRGGLDPPAGSARVAW